MYKKLIHSVIFFFLTLIAGGVAQAGLAEWEAAISASHPLHWYKFNETGTTCIDSGSGGLNGIYKNVSLCQRGFFGQETAVGFNERIGAKFVNFSEASDLPAPWTVEYIIKTTKVPSGYDPQALHDSDSTSIRLAGWTTLGEAGFTQYEIEDFRFIPVEGLTLNDLVIQQDVWMHLVWRNDGSGTQLFFDGVLVGTTTDMIDLPRLRIGARVRGTYSISGQLQGILDEAVVFNRALTNAEIFNHASSIFLTATNPKPEDGAIYKDHQANLTWTAGFKATSHDVYFGDSFADVKDGTDSTFQGNQFSSSFDVGLSDSPCPDGLIPGTTYYWRVDEVNHWYQDSPWIGDVWSFTIPYVKGGEPIVNEVWEEDDSPLHVISDLFVENLTIMPGVVVEFSGNYRVTVKGVIRVVGTPESPVILRPSEDNTEGWRGIYFENRIPGSEFEWCHFVGAHDKAVWLVRSNPTFRNCTFTDNESLSHGGAICADLADGDLIISDCEFRGNSADVSGGAIWADMGTGTLFVENCNFIENVANPDYQR